jgi:hypothetical protein
MLSFFYVEFIFNVLNHSAWAFGQPGTAAMLPTPHDMSQ